MRFLLILGIFVIGWQSVYAQQLPACGPLNAYVFPSTGTSWNNALAMIGWTNISNASFCAQGNLVTWSIPWWNAQTQPFPLFFPNSTLSTSWQCAGSGQTIQCTSYKDQCNNNLDCWPNRVCNFNATPNICASNIADPLCGPADGYQFLFSDNAWIDHALYQQTIATNRFFCAQGTVSGWVAPIFPWAWATVRRQCVGQPWTNPAFCEASKADCTNAANCPECGVNYGLYTRLDTTWKDPSTGWFCINSSIINIWSQTTPQFPLPITRTWLSEVNRTCENTSKTKNVQCRAYIPAINACGINAWIYLNGQNTWNSWTTFPTFPNPDTGFCEVGIPFWNTPIQFPTTGERTNNRIRLQRICDINGDRSQICSATLDPVNNGTCGINAWSYSWWTHNRRSTSLTWFCQSWSYLWPMSGNNFIPFPQRDQRVWSWPITIQRTCTTVQWWVNSECEAVIHPIPQCGINATRPYTPSSMQRYNSGDVWFCLGWSFQGILNDFLPQFPDPVQRLSGMLLVPWSCRNDVWESIECKAEFPKVNVCGQNARYYWFWDIDWLYGSTTTSNPAWITNTNSGFCLIWEPRWNWFLRFPTPEERLIANPSRQGTIPTMFNSWLPTITLRWFCTIDNVNYPLCTANVAPIQMGTCGPNAREYWLNDTNRTQDSQSWFCISGIFSWLQENYDFSRYDRSIRNDVVWWCVSPEWWMGQVDTCLAVVHQTPQCGSNATTYYGYQTAWSGTATTDFCERGTLVQTTSSGIPRFPLIGQRTWEDITVQRWCRDAIGQTLTCNAIVKPFDPCGENARDYRYRQKWWHRGLDFPQNSNEWFCVVGTPWWYKNNWAPFFGSRYPADWPNPVPFPTDQERTDTIVDRRWFCAVPNGDGSFNTDYLCTATFEPVFHGDCGINVWYYSWFDTEWRDPSLTWFCKYGLFSWKHSTNTPRAFPSFNERTQTFSTWWYCNSLDGWGNTFCPVTFFATPQCGANAIRHGAKDTLWPYTGVDRAGFCTWGIFQDTDNIPPLFPAPQNRIWWTWLTWECRNELYETVSCHATFEQVDACGINAQPYFYRQTQWYNATTFQPGVVNLGFCEIGVPFWYTSLPFPSIDQRRVLPLYRQWYCSIPTQAGYFDNSTVCTATIAPISQWACGVNATMYGMTMTGWIDPTYSWFCKEGTYGDDTALMIFPSTGQRTSNIRHTWRCYSEEGDDPFLIGNDFVECHADIYAIPQCGVNNGFYSSITSGRRLNTATWFCAGDPDPFWPPRSGTTIVWWFPLFPWLGARVDQTLLFPRQCRNSLDERVDCEAEISVYEPCGINATTYTQSETQRKETAYTWFCVQWVVSWSWQAWVMDFPRLRTGNLVHTRECWDEDRKLASCQAHIPRNNVVCGTLSWQSFFNLDAVGPESFFCNDNLIATGKITIWPRLGSGYWWWQHNLGLGTGRWWWTCERFSDNDGQLIDRRQCYAHRSCTRQGFEYPHGAVVNEFYYTQRPPAWQSCDDVKVTQPLTCHEWYRYRWSGANYPNNPLEQNYVDRCDDSANRVCVYEGRNYPNGQTITLFKSAEVGVGQSCTASGQMEMFTCDWWLWTGSNGWNITDYTSQQCSSRLPLSCVFWPRQGQQITIPHNTIFSWFKNDIVSPWTSCSANSWSTNLLCFDGTVTIASWSTGQVSMYPYFQCSERPGRDCAFDGMIVRHGETVTWWNFQNPWAGQICQSQARTCTDGTLSWSFPFSFCTATNAECGDAINLSHTTQPNQSLCRVWIPVWSWWTESILGRISLKSGMMAQFTTITGTRQRTPSLGLWSMLTGNTQWLWNPLQYCQAVLSGTTAVVPLPNQPLYRCEPWGINCRQDTMMQDQQTFECVRNNTGSNIVNNRWRWTCQWLGWWQSTICEAPYNYIPPVPGECGDFPQPIPFMTQDYFGLCKQGNPINFQSSLTGRTWQCLGTTSLVTTCRADNTVLPQARVMYDKGCPANPPVRAQLTWFSIPWTKIINNNGADFHIFEKNGEFVFEIEAGWRRNTITARVDCINEREQNLETIIDVYERNSCPLYQNITFEDINDSHFTLDIITMRNTCVMHGYQWSNRSMFLPRQNLSRCEAILSINRLGSAIANYQINNPEWTWYPKYPQFDQFGELGASVVVADKIGLLDHITKRQLSQGQLFARAGIPSDQDTIISQTQEIRQWSQLPAWTTLAPGTVIRWLIIQTWSQTVLGRRILAHQIDPTTQRLRIPLVLQSAQTTTNVIIAAEWSLFPKGTRFWTDVQSQTAYQIDCDAPITRTERTNMMMHLLKAVNGNDKFLTRLLNETQFASRDLLMRGEAAYLYRRLLEEYIAIPIGQDKELLKWLYVIARWLPVTDQIRVFDTVSTTIRRMDPDQLGKYWLTKFRLLSDMSALRQNTLPQRRDRPTITLDQLFRNYVNRFNPTQLLQEQTIKRIWDDRYDELEL